MKLNKMVVPFTLKIAILKFYIVNLLPIKLDIAEVQYISIKINQLLLLFINKLRFNLH